MGPAALSDAELIAIMLRTGTKGETAVDLAERILTRIGGLQQLPRTGRGELNDFPGLGEVKEITLLALAELAKRLNRGRGETAAITSPGDAAALVMEDMRHNLREHFRVLLLDTKNTLLGTEEISIGSLNASLIHPREVFRPAIQRSAASVILVHNHPSGDPTPSREDLDVTRRLCEAGRLLGIEVTDHVVIGDGRYVSFREKGLL